MRQPNPVTDFLDVVTREFSFDPALSLRVRKEVEDHLWQAIVSEPAGPTLEAQQRVLANFGDARQLARQYAATSLLAQVKRVGAITILTLAGIFVAMKSRVAWYALTHWELDEGLKSANAIGIPIDRYAFMLALAAAIIGLTYIITRRVPTEFHQAYGRELNRCIVLCAVASSALTISVIVESVLTGLRLLGTVLSVSASIPALSMAAEVALMSLLVFYIRQVFRRAAHAAALASN